MPRCEVKKGNVLLRIFIKNRSELEAGQNNWSTIPVTHNPSRLTLLGKIWTHAEPCVRKWSWRARTYNLPCTWSSIPNMGPRHQYENHWPERLSANDVRALRHLLCAKCTEHSIKRINMCACLEGLAYRSTLENITWQLYIALKLYCSIDSALHSKLAIYSSNDCRNVDNKTASSWSSMFFATKTHGGGDTIISEPIQSALVNWC